MRFTKTGWCIWRALAEAGQLVIMTTHDLEPAAQADRLLLLGPGGLVADGPLAGILGDVTPRTRLGMSVPEWLHAEHARRADGPPRFDTVGEPGSGQHHPAPHLISGSFHDRFRDCDQSELRLALEWFRIPYRYAFSLSVAFQSLGLLDDEWRAILEAQRARGAWSPTVSKRSVRMHALLERAKWQEIIAQVHKLVVLTVPAIVLTTKRAWTMAEAAYARGLTRRIASPSTGSGWTVRIGFC